jgi:hypothetical protein
MGGIIIYIIIMFVLIIIIVFNEPTMTENPKFNCYALAQINLV